MLCPQCGFPNAEASSYCERCGTYLPPATEVAQTYLQTAILSGMPVIKGALVPVARILSLLKEGYLLEEIHRQFDHSSIATLQGALEEAATLINNTSHGSQVV